MSRRSLDFGMKAINSGRRLSCQVYFNISGGTGAKLRHLRQSQWWTVERLEQERQEGLTTLLRAASASVPYYTDVLSRSGVVARSGQVDLSRFNRIPVLEKATIKSEGERLYSCVRKRDWTYNTSGGSTGEPVRLVQDQEYRSWNRAMKALFDLWTGYRPGDPKLLLWGSERDLRQDRVSPSLRFRRWLRNEVWVNAFLMEQGDLASIRDLLTRMKPQQVTAYAEVVYEIARRSAGEVLGADSVESVMTTAGTLESHMRKTIERAFSARVFNRYGSREVGDIACACESGEGLHLASPNHYVEVLDADLQPVAEGSTGEVFVTLLTNNAMPLIRYRIGDLATRLVEPCPCGRNWPRLGRVVGRTSDMFETRRGDLVHGEYFTHLFYLKDWVRTFQVVQEDYERVVVYVVPDGDLAVVRAAVQEDLGAIRDQIHLVLGEATTVEFRFVSSIDRSPSGKRRYTISLVRRAADQREAPGA